MLIVSTKPVNKDIDTNALLDTESNRTLRRIHTATKLQLQEEDRKLSINSVLPCCNNVNSTVMTFDIKLDETAKNCNLKAW